MVRKSIQALSLAGGVEGGRRRHGQIGGGGGEEGNWRGISASAKFIKAKGYL